MMKLFFDRAASVKQILALIWHHGSIFLRTGRYMPPVIAWVLVMYVCYQPAPPLYAVPAYVSASAWLFYIMPWFSYAFMSGFELVSEHLLILHINSRRVYALSKLIFLLLSCLVFSFIGSIYPVAINFLVYLIRGVSVFPEGITPAHVAGALLLHFMCGMLGISVVFLFQPYQAGSGRNDFKLMMIIIFALIALAKQQITNTNSIFGYLLWVFPPLNEMISLFFEKDRFMSADIAYAVLFAVVYSTAAVVIGQIIYNRRTYGPHIARRLS